LVLTGVSVARLKATPVERNDMGPGRESLLRLFHRGARRGFRAVVTLALTAALTPCLATTARAAPPVVESGPLAPEQQREKFKLPAGFEIQVVAAEPQIQKPMNMAFDARGRLWVTHSVEYPFAAAADKKPRDGLTILEDFGPDGRARKATLFADELNIPIGVLPLPRPPGGKTAAIVWSIPHIWKLTDTDDDGKADQREILYGPFAFADTHGNQNSFRLGADGWVYANHGFRNDSQVRLRGEGDVVLTLNSGNTYRFRPDGSAIEQVTWGQVNPFGMSFDALGNRFNADCHTSPLTLLLPGGRYPSLFAGRNADYDDGLGGAPAMTNDGHGSTGIAAVAISDTDRFPPAYRDQVFVGNVVNCRVHADALEWRGSSPWVQKPTDFLTCDDLWFRPVDLQLGPDGGLYVADFYNCIIGHYEVDLKHPRRDRERGRIWRVVWKGEPGGTPVEPTLPKDLTKLSDEALVARLGDPTETVRRLAMEELVERGRGSAAVVDLLRRKSPVEHHRARAVRALALLGKLDAATIAAALADESRLVRVHLVKAVQALPSWDEGQAELVRGRLADPDPFVRRAAAEALARHPSRAAIEPLLRCWAETPGQDPQLVHALRIAVRFQLAALKPEDWAAIDAPGNGVARLCEIAALVPNPAAARRALHLASTRGMPAAAWDKVLPAVARQLGPAEVDSAARAARAACGEDAGLQARILRSLLGNSLEQGRGPGSETELGRWAVDVACKTLSDGGKGMSDDLIKTAVVIAKGIKAPKLTGAWGDIAKVAGDARRNDLIRGEAIAALSAIDRSRTVDAATALIAAGAAPYPVRITFARQCASADAPAFQAAIAGAMKLATAAQQKDWAMVLLERKEGGSLLLDLIGSGRASALLLQDGQVVGRLKQQGIADLDERIKTLTAGLQPADKRIQDTIGRVAGHFGKAGGSAETGGELFVKNCAACHRYANRGGLVGPQLDGVGQRGADRLLEDILDPSRNVDEAFRTTTVTLADGRVVSGLRLREEDGSVVFADATGKEVRVPKGEIEETMTSRLSPMPANVIDLVGEANLPHLLAYLLQQPAKAP
jgi:putative membrane-bound dehydrogenase-like protein